MPVATYTEAATRILDVAEDLAQASGYNGFSFADVAARLAVTKASLHYHFPSKADLGRALVARYRDRFEQALGAIGRQPCDPAGQLGAFLELYARVVQDERMCLCGMFAAEYATLPQPMREELRAFFDGCEGWLAGILAQGAAAHSFRLQEPPRERARLILCALEGAMVAARVHADGRRFQAVADQLRAALE